MGRVFHRQNNWDAVLRPFDLSIYHISQLLSCKFVLRVEYIKSDSLRYVISIVTKQCRYINSLLYSMFKLTHTHSGQKKLFPLLRGKMAQQSSPEILGVLLKFQSFDIKQHIVSKRLRLILALISLLEHNTPLRSWHLDE